MKKLTLLLVLVLISATFLAARGTDYVITNEGTYFLKNVKYGLKCYIIGKSETGKSMKFSKNDIKAYSKDGIVFEKMPVYKNNLPTGEENFMKIVRYRNGLKLYEYEYISKVTNTLSRRYYVFKENKFVLEMDDANRANLTAFFKSN